MCSVLASFSVFSSLARLPACCLLLFLLLLLLLLQLMMRTWGQKDGTARWTVKTSESSLVHWSSCSVQTVVLGVACLNTFYTKKDERKLLCFCGSFQSLTDSIVSWFRSKNWNTVPWPISYPAPLSSFSLIAHVLFYWWVKGGPWQLIKTRCYIHSFTSSVQSTFSS